MHPADGRYVVLLAIERSGRRDVPALYVGHISDVDHPQMHLRIDAARRWIADAARFREGGLRSAGGAVQHTGRCHRGAGGEPRIGHHADGRIVEGGVDEPLSVR